MLDSKFTQSKLRRGAPGPIRTVDTSFRRAVLYPLSYGGMVEYSTMWTVVSEIQAADTLGKSSQKIGAQQCHFPYLSCLCLKTVAIRF